MKKSLMALAVLGAVSGAASAQSSVTLYGLIDVSVQYFDQGVNVGTTAVPVYRSESVWRIQSGYTAGSRWGLRGSEALGGNWNAVFTLEGGFDVDTGQLGQGGRLFGRQAWVGLQHNSLGYFVAGRIATPSSGTGSFDLFGFVDPFGTAWGINGLNNTFIAANATRYDNSVAWSSPTWAGFKFGAQYSANVSGQETAPQGTNTQAYSLGGQLNWSIVKAAVTYDVLNPGDGLASTFYGNPNQKMLQVGAVLDFKFLTINGAWANQDNIRIIQAGANPGSFNPVPGAPYDNQAYMIGATVPLGGFKLLASYQYSDAKNVTGLTGTGVTYSYEPDYSIWGIGASYNLSRRTMAYIGYGQSSWDGTISQAGVVNTGIENRFDVKQFAIGMRHVF